MSSPTLACTYLKQKIRSFETKSLKQKVGSLVSGVMASFQNKDCFVLHVVYNLYMMLWISILSSFKDEFSKNKLIKYLLLFLLVCFLPK